MTPSLIQAPALAGVSGHGTTPACLEVGILDSTHGWLKIRAEIADSRQINTTLTVSTPAHDALHSELPQLAGFLAAENIGVAKVDLLRHPPATGPSTGEQQAGSSSDTAPQHSDDAAFAEGAMGDGQSRGRQSSQQIAATPVPAYSRGPASATTLHRVSYGTRLMNETGGWLSICA